MDVILLVLAIIAAVIGAFTLSEATLGVGVIGLACFLAIMARLAQAGKQHQEVMRGLYQHEPPAKSKGSGVGAGPAPM